MAEITYSHGIDWDGSKFVEKPLTFSLAEDDNLDKPLGLGKPISVAAFTKMVKDYIEKYKSEPEKTIYVTFGKEILLQLLTQAGCEALKFVFCINPSGDESLAVLGLDGSGTALARETIINNTLTKASDDPTKPPPPPIGEVGGGGKIGGGGSIAGRDADVEAIFQRIL